MFFRVAIEVAAQDWPFLYQKNFQIYMEAYNKAKELELIKAKKQGNYIYREQEYRRVIQELKIQIDTISQKPLERQQDKSADQLQLENINLKLK